MYLHLRPPSDATNLLKANLELEPSIDNWQGEAWAGVSVCVWAFFPGFRGSAMLWVPRWSQKCASPGERASAIWWKWAHGILSPVFPRWFSFSPTGWLGACENIFYHLDIIRYTQGTKAFMSKCDNISPIIAFKLISPESLQDRLSQSLRGILSHKLCE